MNTTLDSLKTIIKSYFTQSALGESLKSFSSSVDGKYFCIDVYEKMQKFDQSKKG